MNDIKTKNKLKNYWLNDQSFRAFIWENFVIYQENKVYCNSMWFDWRRLPFADIGLNYENQLWGFLVGFHFSERQLEKYDLNETSQVYYHLGVELGQISKIWKMMSWAAQNASKDNKIIPWPGGMPYDTWGISDREFLAFYDGIYHPSLIAEDNGIFNQAGRDLHNETICGAILKLARNKNKLSYSE